MASGEKGVRGLTTLWCGGLRENPNRLSRQKSLNKIQKIKQQILQEGRKKSKGTRIRKKNWQINPAEKHPANPSC